MGVVKWSDKVEQSGDDIDSPLFGGLYKEEKDQVSWSGTYPDAKMTGAGMDWVRQEGFHHCKTTPPATRQPPEFMWSCFLPLHQRDSVTDYFVDHHVKYGGG